MNISADDFDKLDEFDISDGIVDNSWYSEVVETPDVFCPIGSDRQLCSGCNLQDNCRWLITG
jgi:hypothetical protein